MKQYFKTQAIARTKNVTAIVIVRNLSSNLQEMNPMDLTPHPHF